MSWDPHYDGPNPLRKVWVKKNVVRYCISFPLRVVIFLGMCVLGLFLLLIHIFWWMFAETDIWKSIKMYTREYLYEMPFEPEYTMWEMR